MSDKRVKRYPLSKQVSDQLEKMIAAGEYAVGEKIPPETELMEIFKVSRNTLREAIQSLTSAGVLEVCQGDGTYVRSNNRFDANMNREYARASLEDIHEARNSLEMTIVYLAAQRRTDEDMDRITGTFLRRCSLNQTVKENTKADMEFHMAIAKASHNEVLFDMYRSISGYLETQILKRQMETELDAGEIDRLHKELSLAIQLRQPDEARKCAQNILEI